jgi:hypothetical protein
MIYVFLAYFWSFADNIFHAIAPIEEYTSSIDAAVFEYPSCSLAK